MKITPVLFVDQIEPCLAFWVERLGFEKTVEVPDGMRLAFVALQKGAGEVMVQTFESARKDVGERAAPVESKTYLYIEVEDFAGTLKHIHGVDVVVPERSTFYGMREIAVREPGGHVVCFAARENAQSSTSA